MNIPFVKAIKDSLYSSPYRFAGGLIPNLLGYHVLRVLYFNATHALRHKRMPADPKARAIAETVLKDGIAIIPNYFPADLFEKLKAEAHSIPLRIANERAPRIRKKTVVSDGDPGSNALFKKHFAEDQVVNSVVAAVMRKDVIITPKVQFEETSYAAEDIGKQTTDVQSDNIHFDVSYATMRTFFYMDDIDESNAAFMYAKGSQHISLARLWMEYKMSVNFFRWSKHRQNTETPGVPMEFMDAQGFKLESIVGKANTLVIANTMGLHRRGSFSRAAIREVMGSSWSSLESARYIKRKLFPRS